MEKNFNIAVIGAGSCGLAAIKSCKEEGFEVTAFERSTGIGGLWNYNETNVPTPSTMSFTTINTHKEMSAFSDFPPPDTYPNYMHNSQVLQYFTMYAKQFDLFPHIRFQHEVLSVERSPDYEESGRWKVTVRSLVDHHVEERIFDGVMVCSGHHVQPSLPAIQGLDVFRGSVQHSQSLKYVESFKGLNVLVVGIGNSGADAAVEISHVAKQVYLSTRKGSWVLPRSGPYGLPYDVLLSNRFVILCLKILGWRIISLIGETLILNQFFNHSLYGLKPKHRLLSQHPTINDTLPSKILSGRILVRNDIERFTEDGVIFKSNQTIIPLDAVVFATGYKVELPFLDDNFLRPENNKVDLYKLTFPPTLTHPTFALIGMVQPLGCLFPIGEAQSRWFCQLMKGNCRLPSLKKMQKEIKQRRKEMEERFVASPRHTLQVDFASFMDDVSSEYGAAPNMMKLLFTDPQLFLTCFFGPCLPYQYRLQGLHSTPKARELIMNYPSRVIAPLKSNLSSQSYSSFEFFRIFNLLPLIYVLPVLIICIILIFV